MKRMFFISVLAALISGQADAALEWATWGPPSGTTSVGRFSNGRQIVLGNANFTGVTAGVAASTEFTAVPQIPGRPDNTNPAFQRLLTGAPGTFMPAGTVVAEVDLGGITVDAATTLGLIDLKQSVYYKLEVRDGARNLLSLSGITSAAYNVTYIGNALVADLNSVLVPATGLVNNDNLHDGGGSYSHTGLTTFANFPAGTRYISLTAAFDNQEVEGIGVFVAADVNPVVEVTDSQGSATDHTIAFGTRTIDSVSSETVTVTNATAAPAVIGIIEGLANPFAIVNPGDCTRTVPAGQSCTLTITFRPTSTSPATDTLTLNLAGTPQAVTVSGSGRAATFSVSDSLGTADDRQLPFGSTVQAGSTGTATYTINNTDTVAVTVNLTDAPAAPYGFVGSGCDGVTLNAGASCTVTVQFAPAAAGTFNDTISYSAGGATISLQLSGSPSAANGGGGGGGGTGGGGASGAGSLLLLVAFVLWRGRRIRGATDARHGLPVA